MSMDGTPAKPPQEIVVQNERVVAGTAVPSKHPNTAPKRGQAVPRATHNGVLPFGDIPCAVLEAPEGEIPLREGFGSHSGKKSKPPHGE